MGLRDSAPAHGARIVLIEDDPIIRDLVTSILSGAGITVDVVDHGDDALEEIWRHQPDLVILDCGLPGRPGLAILEDLRASTILADLPVLMLSGRRSEWSETIAISRGANGYLRKPFAPCSLVDAVQKLVSQGKARHFSTPSVVS